MQLPSSMASSLPALVPLARVLEDRQPTVAHRLLECRQLAGTLLRRRLGLIFSGELAVGAGVLGTNLNSLFNNIGGKLAVTV